MRGESKVGLRVCGLGMMDWFDLLGLGFRSLGLRF